MVVACSRDCCKAGNSVHDVSSSHRWTWKSRIDGKVGICVDRGTLPYIMFRDLPMLCSTAIVVRAAH